MTRYAFHHMPALKIERLRRQRAHVEKGLLKAARDFAWYEQDRHERFCTVGCDFADITGLTRESDWVGHDLHEVIAKHDGLPVWIEHIREIVFDGLDNTLRPERMSPARWHTIMTETIPVGANMDMRFFQICRCFVLWRIRSLDLTSEQQSALRLTATALGIRALSETVPSNVHGMIRTLLDHGDAGQRLQQHVRFIAETMLRIDPEETGRFLAQIIDLSLSYPDADIPVSVYPDIARKKSRSPLSHSGKLHWKPSPHRAALYDDFALLVLQILKDGSIPKTFALEKVAA